MVDFFLFFFFKEIGGATDFEPRVDAVEFEGGEGFVEVHLESDDLRRPLADLFVIGGRCTHKKTVVTARSFLRQLTKNETKN